MDESINRRLVALMAMTTANGCTEEEAMTAAQKVQDLLNKYQINLSDIEIRNSPIDQGSMDMGQKQKGPMFWVMNSIGYFTDTKTWVSWKPNGDLDYQASYQFLGLKHDVEIAKYIFKVCEWAIIWEWEEYKKTQAYKGHYNKGHVKSSFEAGITASISRKLREMKDAQRRSNMEGSGRDLVVVKKPMIDEAFDQLGIKFKKKTGKKVGRTIHDSKAYYSGQAAGENVNINPGVSGSSSPSLID